MNKEQKNAFFLQYIMERDIRHLASYKKMKAIFFHFNNGDDFEEQKKQDYLALIRAIILEDMKEIQQLFNKMGDE